MINVEEACYMHHSMKCQNTLYYAILLALPVTVMAADPSNWITTIDSSFYNGSTGTITFNDWGYVGPNGATANTFAVTSTVTGVTGFDASRIGQTQTVVTQNPDWASPDPTITATMSETSLIERTNASQDAQVNFYQWTYTTVGGSTFNNMQIDKAGNYLVAQNDMAFQFYDGFQYHDETGTNPDRTIDTRINFQPYAVSDALGWCGSTLVTNPNGLEVMAGQVQFDFAFDVYVNDANRSLAGGDTQVVPDFIMRSYGSYDVNVWIGGDNTHYTGSAVMNNNNPELNPLNANGEATGAALDPAYQNLVSFLGAGIIPAGVWVTADSYNADGSKRLKADGNWDVHVAGDGMESLCGTTLNAPPVAGAVCYGNSFAGYAFLMRADGSRELTYIGETGHSDYVATDAAAYLSIGQAVPSVPVPAAVWLFGSGMIGLFALARRHKQPA